MYRHSRRRSCRSLDRRYFFFWSRPRQHLRREHVAQLVHSHLVVEGPDLVDHRDVASGFQLGLNVSPVPVHTMLRDAHVPGDLAVFERHADTGERLRFAGGEAEVIQPAAPLASTTAPHRGTSVTC